jgi:hypothetical protein
MKMPTRRHGRDGVLHPLVSHGLRWWGSGCLAMQVIVAFAHWCELVWHTLLLVLEAPHVELLFSVGLGRSQVGLR